LNSFKVSYSHCLLHRHALQPHIARGPFPARVQGVEVGDAAEAEHDCLAVDDELPMPVLQRRLDDPREAIGPVVRAARDQANAIPVALQAQALAVVFTACSQTG
jgi:hypothetical protein